MPGAQNKVDDPCEECRTRHLKCDDNRPKCSQCEKSGQKCCRTKGQRKFRDGSSAQYEKQFSKDQVWLGFSKNAKIQIVDQTAELENFYAVDEPEPTPPPLTERPKTAPQPPSSADSSVGAPRPPLVETVDPSAGQYNTRSDAQFASPTQASPTSFENILSLPGTKRRRTSESIVPSEPYRPVQLPPILQEASKTYPVRDSPSSVIHQPSTFYSGSYASPTEFSETRKIEAEYAKLADSEAAKIPDEPLLSFSSWRKSFAWPNQYTTQQCICLFKYYIDVLGPWFDVGDPTRQFTAVVPQRARRCPPLLNAIFSAAALHLRYAQRDRPPGKAIHYGGYDLPNLNLHSTIKYYQATTAYLRALCDSTEHVKNEDMLASTVIIRFYEELEELINGFSEAWIVRPFRTFVASQARPEIFDFNYDDYDFRLPGAFTNVRPMAERYLKSFQHGCFRIALRQECQRALVNRQEVELPLAAWKLLEGFDETDDSVWTDRHLYHFANVLQFCFSGSVSNYERVQRWQELQDFEARWEEARPLSFSHYHRKDPDTSRGEVFPQIWYVHEVNAIGMLYYHLARILLTVYNPHLHRIGPGAAAAQRRVSEGVRAIVKQLCGVAMSTVQIQPVLVVTYNAIAMFGEHFSDRREQEALLEVLAELESKHGWPVSKDAEALKHEWGWYQS